MQDSIPFSFPDAEAEGWRGGSLPGHPAAQATQLVPLLIKYRTLDESMKCHPLGWPSCLPAFLPGLACLPLSLWISLGKAGRAVICSLYKEPVSGWVSGCERTRTEGQGTWCISSSVTS